MEDRDHCFGHVDTLADPLCEIALRLQVAYLESWRRLRQHRRYVRVRAFDPPSREENADKFRVIDTVNAQKGARTMAIDSKTHRFNTATAKVLPGRKVVPNTFVVLVVSLSFPRKPLS